eukprot:GFKZ01009971.1.p1 GENE.GFKZ01009971.1~~GFKZ01009971.1.p1  ORF type:complete len:1025 (+),score=164.88 GFKZ01009971.1:351-3425(+)
MTTRQSRRSTLNAARRKSRRSERVAKVNDAVEIWWSVDKTFYRGTLTRRHGEDNFRVVYDDGETEDLDLTKEFWRFADDPATERGTASKDNQDIVEVVLDGSDAPSVDASKQTRKPQRKKDKKQPEEKAPEKKIPKQNKPSTAEKSAGEKTSSQQTGKSSAAEKTPPRQAGRNSAAAKRSTSTPGLAKRSSDTSGPADQVSDVVTPATPSDLKPSPVTPSRTRAKPKVLKARTVEKQSTRAKSQITKPMFCLAVPPLQKSTHPSSSPSRGAKGVKAQTPGTSEQVKQADGVGKATSSKNKSIVDSKVKTSVLLPKPAVIMPKPTDSLDGNVDGGLETVAQNELDKRSRAQGEVKMGPAKAIGKAKKSVHTSRPKSTRTRAARKTMEQPQDEYLPPLEAQVKGGRSTVSRQPASVNPTRKMPIPIAPAPYIPGSTEVESLKVAPTQNSDLLPKPSKKMQADHEIPQERSAPSFAADRKRKRKVRSASLTNGSMAAEVPEKKGGKLGSNSQPDSKRNASSTALDKAKQNDIPKEVALSEGRVSDENTTKTPVKEVKPPAKSLGTAQIPDPDPAQSRSTADLKSKDDDGSKIRPKRSRLDDELAVTQKDLDDAETQAASKRMRSAPSHPQNTALSRTTDPQFTPASSPEELARLITRAVTPSKAMIENLRSDVQDIFSAVSKMKEEKKNAGEAFQKTALNSVNELRTSILEVKAELLEVVDKKAREAESRLTATVERLFSELLQKVVTKGPDRESGNNPETTRERTTILTEDGDAHRPRGRPPLAVQPSEHQNSRNMADEATRPFATQPMNGRGESPTAVGNISPERVNPCSNTPGSDTLRAEGDTSRYAVLKARVSHLAARQVTVWLLETPHEYEPSSGPVEIWARNVATLIFKKVVEQLMRFESYIKAYQTLCSSLGNDAVELQWFVSPDVRDHLDRARRNYGAWDPPPTDEEWKSEVLLLKELSQRFNSALKRCEYSSMPDIQACIAVADMASREELSPNSRHIHYRNSNGVDMGANRGFRTDP